jgi:Zn-dependent peptidase ImmA (M78 family)
MQPEPSTLLKIAEVLKVTPYWLSQGDILEDPQIEFSTAGKLNASEKELIFESILDSIERIKTAESLSGMETNFSNPLQKIVIKAPEDVENAANLLREKWNLGTKQIVNLGEVLEENGIYVIETKWADSQDYLIGMVNKKMPAIVVNSNDSIFQKRFTTLKALGYLLLSNNIQDENDQRIIVNRFGRSLLLPEKEMRQIFGSYRSKVSIAEITRTSKNVGIPLDEIITRLQELKIIKRSYFDHINRQLSNHHLKEESIFYETVEKNKRLKQLIFRLISEGIIEEEKAAILSGLSLDSFRNLYHDISEEDVPEKYEISAFNTLWGDDEPEYTDEDLLTINPFYEGR